MSSSAPWMSVLRPSSSYVRREIVPSISRLRPSPTEVSEHIPFPVWRFVALGDSVDDSVPTQQAKKLSTAEYEVRIGDTEEDFSIAVRAMRSWKMCDALRSTGAHAPELCCCRPVLDSFCSRVLIKWLDRSIK